MSEPVWVQEARRFMGLKEIAGSKSNATIIGWAKRFGGWIASYFKNDDTPWCGLFVGHIVSVTLPKERIPANPLGALQWNTFGVALRQPSIGAILVFKRSGGGHVGFYVGEDKDAYHVLGGNQSNSVSITRIEKSRCVGIRWPASVALPKSGPVVRTLAGSLSTNEA